MSHLASHELAARSYSDGLIDAIIDDLGNRNLRDQRDHETRWLAQRSSALRAERRRRKSLAHGTTTLVHADP
jgi:hypothetical protein